MMERLGRPHKKARTAIPEETTSAPAPDLSEGLERRLSWDHSEATDWHLERELSDLYEEHRLQSTDGRASTGREGP